MDLVETIKVGATLGECPLWCDRTQSLWFTDIEARALYCCNWEERRLERYKTPERLGCFGFVEGGRELIAGFESGFAFFDPRSGAVTWLARFENQGMRLNDGRVDRQGRFWAGTMAEDPALAGRAGLYCFDGSLHIRERGLSIPNSICWSPDSRFFFLSDSKRNVIWRYGFDPASGEISGREVFATTPEGVGPDGSAIDAAGCLWNAQWCGSRVVRYAPDGRVDRVLEVPASRPTSVAFGGPDLNLLFVTSSRDGLTPAELSRESGAGEVFVYNTEFVGLPEHRFSGSTPRRRSSGGQR